MKSLHLHALLIGAWGSIALVVAIKTALLGAEDAALRRQQGADLKARREMAFQKDRLRAAIDWQTSPPILAETVRRLQLPLGRPGETPAAGTAPSPGSVAALERRRTP